VGFAEIAIAGAFRILLPTKRAHPEQREQRSAEIETKRGVKLPPDVCSLCKVSSISLRRPATAFSNRKHVAKASPARRGRLKTLTRLYPNCWAEVSPSRPSPGGSYGCWTLRLIRMSQYLNSVSVAANQRSLGWRLLRFRMPASSDFY